MESVAEGHLVAGRYRLEAVIGRGGMGVVWRARDEFLRRDVAVKEIVWPRDFSLPEKRAACRRATMEAKVAARVSHRNVIRVYDFIEEDGCPWIVMELFSPRSLRDLLREEGRLRPERAAKIGLGILAALRAAHAEGIVHRDVKPSNILMGPDRVALTDFGIARPAGTSAVTATHGVLLGTPAYIAPERARGGPSEPPGDLWGLGASLYAAVEGHGPFDRDGSALASLTAVVGDEPEPATHAGLLWPVIHGLLRKDPGQRLTAAEAERMLRTVAAAPAAPVAAATSSPARPGQRAGAVAWSAAVAVIAGSCTAAGLILASAPPQATAAGIAQPAGVSDSSSAPGARSGNASTRHGTPAGEHGNAGSREHARHAIGPAGEHRGEHGHQTGHASHKKGKAGHKNGHAGHQQ